MIFCELLNDVVPLDVRIGISGARDLEREPLNGMAVRMGRACRASFAGIYQIDLRKCTDGVLVLVIFGACSSPQSRTLIGLNTLIGWLTCDLPRVRDGCSLGCRGALRAMRASRRGHRVFRDLG